MGQTARVVGEDKATGKVVFISVQAQAETGNVAVKVRFPNKDLSLRANSVVRVLVQTASPTRTAFTVNPDGRLGWKTTELPAIVVVRDLETKEYDGKPEKIGKALKLEVQVGVRDREHGLVEVLAVEAPDKKEKLSLKDVLVVTEGAHGLHDGDAVKLEEEEEHDKE